MDLDGAKENIQPLATGRNATVLQASLMESPQELLSQRRELEKCIHNYKGDDPLEPWYTYIDWIEQSYPSGGKESGLEEVLTKCLSHFESESKYYQDRRMVKLYIKFIESHKSPTECFQQLFNAGIGTMVADLYICWAYHYDMRGNFRKAEEIFSRGIACRAQPLEELQEAHQHFGYTVAQRIMYKDDDNVHESTKRELHERRLALTSLRGHKRKAVVGSIRTGAAIKNMMPGMLKTEKASSSRTGNNANENVNVFDENVNPNLGVEATIANRTEIVNSDPGAVVRSIIDTSRNQENQKEPGPWNKAHLKKPNGGSLFGRSLKFHDSAFNIHIDSSEQNQSNDECWPSLNYENNYEKPFKYPTNFKAKNYPKADIPCPVTTDNESNPRAFPQYSKYMLYPRPNMEFQLEELKAYYWFERRGITNDFTKSKDHFWHNSVNSSTRQYPNFAKSSLPQQKHQLDSFYKPPQPKNIIIDYEHMYDEKREEEFSFEELRERQMRRYDTICEEADMEETICLPHDRANRRKSFFPTCMRKSVAPGKLNRMSLSVTNQPEQIKAPTTIPIDKNDVNVKPVVVGILQKMQNISNELKEQEIPHAQTSVSNSATTKPPIGIKLSFIRESLEDQDCITDSEINANLEDNASNQLAAGNMCFEIYQDPTVTSIPPKMPNVNVAKTFDVVNDDLENYPQPNQMQFKEPSMPMSVKPIAPRIPFQICTIAPTDAAAEISPITATAGFMDADETCSTQTFNIFLNSHPMSTPKAVHVAPRIQRDLPIPEIPKTPPINDLEVVTAVAIATAGPKLSPNDCPKQLSTILETSEHGTTGSGGVGSTKLLNSSPECEGALDGVHGTPLMRIRKTLPSGTPMETLQEQSKENMSKVDEITENSTTTAVNDKMETAKEMDEGNLIKNTIPKNTMNSIQMPDTPATARLGIGNNRFIPQFAICDDVTEENQANKESIPQTGNFERLETADDTTTNVMSFGIQSQFQEDRTETISKMMLPKLQDDKTETISKILLTVPSTMPTRFEIDDGDDDGDGDVAEATGNKVEIKPPASLNNDWDDDYMDFFCKTPPKLSKQNSMFRTPLPPAYKATPDLKTGQQSTVGTSAARAQIGFSIFENESITAATKLSKKTKLMDSFAAIMNDMDDISMVMGTQKDKHEEELNTKRLFSTSKKTLNQLDNDFSMVMGTQQSELETKPTTITTTKTTLKDTKSDLPMLMGKQAEHLICDSLQKNSQTDSYLAGFSLINEPQIPMQQIQIQPQNMSLSKSIRKEKPTAIETKQNTSILNESAVKFKLPINDITLPPTLPSTTTTTTTTRTPMAAVAAKSKLDEQQFELNAATEMFSTNISMIKNSTLLPKASIAMQIAEMSAIKLNAPPPPVTPIKLFEMKQSNVATINETSITNMPNDSNMSLSLFHKTTATNKLPISPANANKTAKSIQLKESIVDCTRKSLSLHESETKAIQIEDDVDVDVDVDDRFGEMSIYYKATPKTPCLKRHKWDDEDDKNADELKRPTNQISYVHQEVNMNQTCQTIEHLCIGNNVNPFNADLINAFLEQIDFTNYLHELPTCQLVGHVNRLNSMHKFTINNIEFQVLKLIGEGAYGAVYCGIETKSGKKYALKQERPPNYWEYYICLEVQTRLTNEAMIPSYMCVDHALVGNNASILVSNFYEYGSLINVCNKIRKYTNKNLDEYIVMHLTIELLDIIDHLHAIKIIHADIKADNFILMKKLCYPSVGLALHLIDFGVSIDMKLFKENQTFNFIHNDYGFKCVEMREKRTWSYQLDLFGLAGVIHVLLFGKYMDIEKRLNGVWMPKTRLPRYFNKTLWEHIFKNLINIPNGQALPNLQELKAELKCEILHKEKYLQQKICEFNNALQS